VAKETTLAPEDHRTAQGEFVVGGGRWARRSAEPNAANQKNPGERGQAYFPPRPV
jgi:hypothetical protein